MMSKFNIILEDICSYWYYTCSFGNEAWDIWKEQHFSKNGQIAKAGLVSNVIGRGLAKGQL